MKKVIFSAALLMAAATFSFADTPKRETKAEAKSEVKTQTTFVYYVIGQTATNYTLSTSPAPQCGSGTTYPCKIESDEELDLSVPKADVDSNPDVSIITRRQSL